METGTTDEHKDSGRRDFFLHQARTSWMLLSAIVAVTAGFVTLNMTQADSGLAVLNEHFGPWMAHLAKLTKTQ